jgi:hypothetical protein
VGIGMFTLYSLSHKNRPKRKVQTCHVTLLTLFVFACSLCFVQTNQLRSLASQTQTVTKTIQNADDRWTVVEYPLNKEVIVELTPTVPLVGAEGRATVLRMQDQTIIQLNLVLAGIKTDLLDKKGNKYRGWQVSNKQFKTCVDEIISIDDGTITKTNETCKGTTITQHFAPIDALNLYAVDSAGDLMLLARLPINNGIGSEVIRTAPLSSFMLVLSPEANLRYLDPNTKIAFRSAVPQGFAVVPRPPVGQTVGAVAVAVGSPYSTPMLGIPHITRAGEAPVDIRFKGTMNAARASVLIRRDAGGRTVLRVRFRGLKKPPVGKSLVLWAVSPRSEFIKLGELVVAPKGKITETWGEITLEDFGLLVTLEDYGTQPSGPAVGVVQKIN